LDGFNNKKIICKFQPKIAVWWHVQEQVFALAQGEVQGGKGKPTGFYFIKILIYFIN
jgi:hypothetical protein